MTYTYIPITENNLPRKFSWIASDNLIKKELDSMVKSLESTAIKNHNELCDKIAEVILKSRTEIDKSGLHDIFSIIQKIDRNDLLSNKTGDGVYNFLAIPFNEKPGQTIPSPHKVFSQALYLKNGLEKGDKLLEIGAGSGYSALVFAYAMKCVKIYSTDNDVDAVKLAESNIDKYEKSYQVKIVSAGSDDIGYLIEAPYQRIFTTMALRSTEQIEKLIDQLEVNGVMRVCVPRIGNNEDKEKTKLWTPEKIIREEDIYYKKDKQTGLLDPRCFIRQSTFVFYKAEAEKIYYTNLNPATFGPMIR